MPLLQKTAKEKGVQNQCQEPRRLWQSTHPRREGYSGAALCWSTGMTGAWAHPLTPKIGARVNVVPLGTLRHPHQAGGVAQGPGQRTA